MMHGGMGRIARTEEEGAKDRRKVVFRLVSQLKPYRRAVAGSFLMIIISAMSQAAGPYLIGQAIDIHIIGRDASGLARTMLTLFAAYFIFMLAMRIQIYLMSWAGQHVLNDLRLQIMEQIGRLALQDLEDDESGDIMSRLVNDIDAINSFLSQGLAQSIGALFSLLGIVAAMVLLEWRLALAALAVVPIMFLTTGQFAKMARQAFRRTRSTIGDVSADLQEELGGVKVAQAFNRSRINVDRFTARNAANRDANVSANTITSAFAPAMDVLSTLDTAIVAGFGGYLAVQEIVTVGVVVSFLQYVQNFFRPIQTVSQIWTLAQSAFAAAERVYELIDRVPKIQDIPNAQELPRLAGQIEFEAVYFAYQTGQPVLQEINFKAAPGQTIAVVGPTGAGKSTLVSLIARFYDVTSGKILVDGQDIRQVTQHSLRSQMGMVLQESFLFSGTVLDNIRYGNLDASEEEIIAAARAANAHGFVERLPEGYNTQVGERGALLSQGQRQLLTIARAILADPRLIILDEATASVDTRTETLIQQALGRLLTGRTSFVIAHRLSTVRNADMVLVLDEGRIVERGTHQALLDQDGLYADLYNRQFYVATREQSQVPEPLAAD